LATWFERAESYFFIPWLYFLRKAISGLDSAIKKEAVSNFAFEAASFSKQLTIVKIQ